MENFAVYVAHESRGQEKSKYRHYCLQCIVSSVCTVYMIEQFYFVISDKYNCDNKI